MPAKHTPLGWQRPPCTSNHHPAVKRTTGRKPQSSIDLILGVHLLFEVLHEHCTYGTCVQCNTYTQTIYMTAANRIALCKSVWLRSCQQRLWHGLKISKGQATSICKEAASTWMWIRSLACCLQK